MDSKKLNTGMWVGKYFLIIILKPVVFKVEVTKFKSL